MLQVGVAFDEKALRRMKDEVTPLVADALFKNAEDILWMAKALCPVETGALRASLHIEQTDEFEYSVRDGVSYGIFVEKGHRDPRTGQFVEPQPFLGPAVERTKQQCVERIKTATMTAKEKTVAEAERLQKRSDAILREMMGRETFGTVGASRARIAARRGK